MICVLIPVMMALFYVDLIATTGLGPVAAVFLSYFLAETVACITVGIVDIASRVSRGR